MKFLFGLLGLLSLLSGCASITGNVTELTPIKADLTAYNAVEIHVTGRETAWESHATNLANFTMVRVQQTKLFNRVAVAETGNRKIASKDPKTLQLRLQIVEIEEGNKTAVAFGVGGEAEVVANGELVGPDGQSLGTIQAKGNSRDRGEWSAGGVNISRISNLTSDSVQKSLKALSSHIARYFKSKMKS